MSLSNDISSKQSISNRQLKVGELIKMALIDALRKGRVKDVRLFDSNVTITEVKVTADLQIANCYVMPFTSNLSKEELLDAFEASKYHLRKIVTDSVKLKYSPELRFHYDYGLDNINQIETLLKNNGS